MKIIDRNGPKIKFSDDILSVVLSHAQGNPGAIAALSAILSEPDGIIYLVAINELGLKGQYIYMLWSDVCGKDIVKFKDALIMMQQGIISDEVSIANLSRGRALPLFDESIARPEKESELPKYYKKQADKFLENYAEELGLPINGN